MPADPTDEQIRHALAASIIALREGTLRAAAFPPDCKSRAEADRRTVPIPARFWCSLLDFEIAGIWARPGMQALDAGLCIRLWETLRRKGTPPTTLAVAVNAQDVRRLWPRK